MGLNSSEQSTRVPEQKASFWYRPAIAGDGSETHTISVWTTFVLVSSIVSAVHFGFLFGRFLSLQLVLDGRA
jgi:hypothetical protein